MTRLNTLLLLALIGCALSVVTSQHKARKFFIELQVEQESERKLDSEWRELQIESQTQGAGRRIEQKAARELGMGQPDAKKTVIVVLDGTVAPSPAVSGLENKKSNQAAPDLQSTLPDVSGNRSAGGQHVDRNPRLTPSPLPDERVRNGVREALPFSKAAN